MSRCVAYGKALSSCGIEFREVSMLPPGCQSPIDDVPDEIERQAKNYRCKPAEPKQQPAFEHVGPVQWLEWSECDAHPFASGNFVERSRQYLVKRDNAVDRPEHRHQVTASQHDNVDQPDE